MFKRIISLFNSRVDKNEIIGRAVFSSTIAKKAKNKNTIPFYAFYTKAHKISVDRLLNLKVRTDLVKIQVQNAQKRKATGFYGWLSLYANKACQDGRYLKASPLINNPYHADTVLPKGGQDILKHHAKALATLSGWQERPGPSAKTAR